MAGTSLWQVVPDRVKQLKRVVKRRAKLREADVVVVSYPKCGRTWLAAMISHVYHQKYGVPENRLIRFDNFHQANREIPKIFFTHNSQRFKPKARLAPLDHFRSKKVILLVRDPRDVVVSLYFHYTKRYLPKNAPGLLQPRYGDADELFDYAMSRLPKVVAFLNDWSRNLDSVDRALLVRYEDLREDPVGQLSRIMSFIGGAFAPEQIENAAEFASFENLREKERRHFFDSGRLHPRDDRDAGSFKVRCGKVGGYRDHFTAEQVERLDAVVADLLVVDLGYGPPRSPAAASGDPVTAPAVSRATMGHA